MGAGTRVKITNPAPQHEAVRDSIGSVVANLGHEPLAELVEAKGDSLKPEQLPWLTDEAEALFVSTDDDLSTLFAPLALASTEVEVIEEATA